MSQRDEREGEMGGRIRPAAGTSPPDALFGDADQARRLRALLRLLQEVREEPRLEVALQRLCDVAHDALGWGKVMITLRGEGGVAPRLRPVASAGFDAHELAALEQIARSSASLDAWRDERFRVGRAYFFDHRVTGGLSDVPYFYRVALGARGDHEWHEEDALVVPIECGSERFGALVVDDPRGRLRPTRDEIEELEALADHAAVAVANARLERRLRATAREAEALFRAATLLVDTTDLERLVEKILDAIDEHFGHPICTLHLREPGSHVLERRATRGHEAREEARFNDLAGPSIVARVARTGEAANVADVRLDPDYVMTIRDTASELAVPLRIDGEVIGVLNVESPTLGAFGDADVRVLTSFAEQAAVALRTAQLHAKIRKQARRDALVNSIISAVHRTHDLNEILAIPCAGLVTALDVQRSYVGVLDWAENVARFVHAFSADGSELFKGSYPLSAMPELSERLWLGEVVAVPDVFDEPMLAAARWSYEKFNTRSLIYMPVAREGDWHAVLLVCCDRIRRWTPDEVAFIRTVAEQVGTAFVQAELFEKVVQAKREWETTFDAMSDGVLLVDADHRIYGANAAAAAMMRVAREDLVGSSCCAALARPDGGACPVNASIAGGARVRLQMVPRRIGRQTQIAIDPMAARRGAVVVLRDASQVGRDDTDARG